MIEKELETWTANLQHTYISVIGTEGTFEQQGTWTSLLVSALAGSPRRRQNSASRLGRPYLSGSMPMDKAFSH